MLAHFILATKALSISTPSLLPFGIVRNPNTLLGDWQAFCLGQMCGLPQGKKLAARVVVK